MRHGLTILRSTKTRQHTCNVSNLRQLLAFMKTLWWKKSSKKSLLNKKRHQVICLLLRGTNRSLHKDQTFVKLNFKLLTQHHVIVLNLQSQSREIGKEGHKMYSPMLCIERNQWPLPHQIEPSHKYKLIMRKKMERITLLEMQFSLWNLSVNKFQMNKYSTLSRHSHLVDSQKNYLTRITTSCVCKNTLKRKNKERSINF